MSLHITTRQAQIVSLIASGYPDKEIASRLGVSIRTVRTHLERLFGRYGLSSRSAAVALFQPTEQFKELLPAAMSVKVPT